MCDANKTDTQLTTQFYINKHGSYLTKHEKVKGKLLWRLNVDYWTTATAKTAVAAAVVEQENASLFETNYWQTGKGLTNYFVLAQPENFISVYTMK